MRPNKGPFSRIVVPFFQVMETNWTGSGCKSSRAQALSARRKPAGGSGGTGETRSGRGCFHNRELLTSITAGREERTCPERGCIIPSTEVASPCQRSLARSLAG